MVVHGDDFVAEGPVPSFFKIEILADGPGEAAQVKVLNRMITRGTGGITWEADPRHLEFWDSQLELTSVNAVKTPGEQETGDDKIFAIGTWMATVVTRSGASCARTWPGWSRQTFV